MPQSGLSPFAWENFYVIIGSSGAALTGLQFVVLALGAESRAVRGPQACGAGGILYTFSVLRRARSQEGYRPVLEDWTWHFIVPFLAYAGILGAAVWLPGHAPQALFVVATSSLLLLLDGIHNAWDTVTYMAIQQSQSPEKSFRKKG